MLEWEWPQDIHYINAVFVTMCFIMTCTSYTSHTCRSRSNETSTCKYGRTNQHWGK